MIADVYFVRNTEFPECAVFEGDGTACLIDVTAVAEPDQEAYTLHSEIVTAHKIKIPRQYGVAICTALSECLAECEIAWYYEGGTLIIAPPLVE